MNINYFKWKVDKAEGFECDDDGLIKYKGEWYTNQSVIALELLPQRAIEGINRDFDINADIPTEQINYRIGEIIVDSDTIEISNMAEKTIWEERLDKYKSILEAKESALQYIYEQENKK